MTNKGIIFVFTALLASCAAQPPVSPASSTPAVAAQSAELAAARKKAFPTDGYKKVVRDGREIFCSKEGYTGSRVQAVERCMTEAQLTAMRESGQDLLRR